MATIGQALEWLEERLFVDRERELEIFRHWLDTQGPLPEILNVSGPGGVGKSVLLRAFRHLALGLGHLVVLIDASDIPDDREGLLHALGGDQVEEVVASLNETRPVIRVDTFEA